MVSSLSHAVRCVELLLADLGVGEGLILVLLLGGHLRLSWHAGVRLRHVVDVLAVQEVVDDLVTVLIVHRLAVVVRAQDVDALVRLVEGSLRHDDWSCLPDRVVLHRRLHPAPMLTLNPKARHSRPFLMIKVYLLLARVGEPCIGHALAGLADADLLEALHVPIILWRYELTRQR